MQQIVPIMVIWVGRQVLALHLTEISLFLHIIMEVVLLLQRHKNFEHLMSLVHQVSLPKISHSLVLLAIITDFSKKLLLCLQENIVSVVRVQAIMTAVEEPIWSSFLKKIYQMAGCLQRDGMMV